jgi:ABC-type enterochelin transport system permease subunit
MTKQILGITIICLLIAPIAYEFVTDKNYRLVFFLSIMVSVIVSSILLLAAWLIFN